MSARLRPAQSGDCDRLAVIWHQAWHDGHAARMPEKLVKLRTLPDFRRRIVPMLEATVVGELDGIPAGFCTIDGDEIAHLFLDREARGSGLAALLLEDAEARLSAGGIETAWLSCAIGNMRAARFYERRGWQRRGSALYQAETSEGVFPIEEWRYEKRLSSG